MMMTLLLALLALAVAGILVAAVMYWFMSGFIGGGG